MIVSFCEQHIRCNVSRCRLILGEFKMSDLVVCSNNKLKKDFKERKKTEDDEKESNPQPQFIRYVLYCHNLRSSVKDRPWSEVNKFVFLFSNQNLRS